MIVPFTVALRTLARLFDVALAVTIAADFQPRDVELQLRAFDGLPEADVHLVFKIGAGLRMLRGLDATAASKDVGEDVAKSAACARAASGRTCAFREVVEVEAAEIEGNFLGVGARAACVLCGTTKSACAKTASAGIGFGCGGIDVVGVEAELIVDLALLGIAEDVVGLGDGLEFLFGRLVAGIHVGMIFARKFAEGLADVLRRGRLLHAEGGVVVLLGGCGHG